MPMTLDLFVPILNQHDLARVALGCAADGIGAETRIVVIDNGSDERFPTRFFLLRNEKNTGVYPTFKQGLENSSADVLGFIHSDLIIQEQNWDRRVLDAFEQNPKLGLLGFIGSNEIDGAGGRGLGTASNFLGIKFRGTDDVRGYLEWTGSPAEAHGKRLEVGMRAAVVDGCAMFFRREALEQIGFREDFPVHHFYDKLMSCQTLEAGWEVGVLGVGCDHISGQTANTQTKYHDASQEWFRLRGVNTFEEVASRYGVRVPTSWDEATYSVAEKLWLSEYRDQKHLIPIKV